MDKLVDDYYNEHPGPLGGTDRKCALDIDTLFGEINLPDSELATLRSVKEVALSHVSVSERGHQLDKDTRCPVQCVR